VAGTSTRTEVVSLRVPKDIVTRWRAFGERHGLSVSALLFEGTQRLLDGDQSSAITLRDLALIPAIEVSIGQPGACVPLVPNDKPVAAVLPVTGVDYPKRPVALRGEKPGKGKKS
jgi:hypothetical protein